MRMDEIFETSRKARVNISVDGEIVARAKALELNMSEVAEAALRRAVKEAELKAWLDTHRRALEQKGRDLDRKPLWADSQLVF